MSRLTDGFEDLAFQVIEQGEPFYRGFYRMIPCCATDRSIETSTQAGHRFFQQQPIRGLTGTADLVPRISIHIAPGGHSRKKRTVHRKSHNLVEADTLKQSRTATLATGFSISDAEAVFFTAPP